MTMVKRHYLTGVVVFLSLAAGGTIASAAETGTRASNFAVQSAAYRHDPQPPFYGYGGYYDYAAPPAVTATPRGMVINGIRIPGAPGTATIEMAPRTVTDIF
jgi:hypothetical protein